MLESSSEIDFKSKASFRRVAQTLSTFQISDILSKKNVESIFVSTKLVKGKNSGLNCITVGVSKKVSKDELHRTDLIPSSIQSILTDVVEVPKMVALNSCMQGFNGKSPAYKSLSGCPTNIHNPDKSLFNCLPAGCSIGPSQSNSAGTLGFFAKNSNGDISLVTNNHVLGSEIYSPKDQPALEFSVSYSNSYVFTDSLGNSHSNPLFNNDDFAFIEADRTYKFFGSDGLNEAPLAFSFSSSFDSQAFNNYIFTEISIYNISGQLIYKNGSPVNNSGRELAFLKDGEYMLFRYSTKNLDSFRRIYYGSFGFDSNRTEVGILFFGTPYCFSSNKQSTHLNYHDGEVNNNNIDLSKTSISYPSNLDKLEGISQITVSNSVNVKPIYFPHPFNSVLSGNHGFQPINSVDAASAKLNKDFFPSQDILGLTDKVPSFKNASIGDRVFKSGRTTGATPREDIFDSHPSVLSTSWTGYVYYCSGTVLDQVTGSIKSALSDQHKAIFTDCLYYSGSGENLYFSDAGDSGSLIFSEKEGELYATGLHFAGFNDGYTSHGLANKIENVFKELSLSPWGGELSLPFSSNEYKHLLDNKYINICGDKYII